MPARTPEKREMLLEDAFLTRDPAALAKLHEEHGSFMTGGLEPVARGRWAISQAAMAVGSAAASTSPTRCTSSRHATRP